VNQAGSSNVADGVNALNHSTGGANTALGTNALSGNTSGASNLALGNAAGLNLTTGSNNIDIANKGVAGEAGKIRIGTLGTQTAAFLAGVSGVTIPGPTKTVVINASGQLGIAPAGTAVSTTPDKTAGRARHQQHEIDQLKREVAQLRALLTHRH
jgi:hypothetical protein